MNEIKSRAALIVSLLVFLANQAFADGDGGNEQARLAIGPAYTGSHIDVRLRSTFVGDSAFILISAGNGPLVGPSLTLYVDAGFILIPGTIGADGLIAFAGLIPNDAVLDGFPIYAQGLVVNGGRVYPSDPHKRIITPTLSATFTDVSTQLPPGTSGNFLGDTDEGDLDGDGDFDLIAAGTFGPYVYINDGAGNFADESAARISFPNPSECVELADVDGDGDLDVFVGGGLTDANDPPAGNALFFNDGSGNFTQDMSFAPGRGFTSNAEFGDIDNDGDLDLVIANGQDSAHGGELPDADSLLINQGNGTFIVDAGFANAPFNDPNRVSTEISLFDCDNDGDLDVFITTVDVPNFGADNLLIRNDGSLSFTDVTASNIVDLLADNAYEAECVDVNNDGYLDIVMAQSFLSAPGVALHLNEGSTNPGVFRESQTFPLPMNSWEAIRLGLDVADTDCDGDLDVLMAVHFLPDPDGVPRGYSQMFINQGSVQGGTIADFVIDPLFGNPFDVFVAPDAAFFDFDLDGDSDIFIPSNGFFGSPPWNDDLWRNDIQ